MALVFPLLTTVISWVPPPVFFIRAGRGFLFTVTAVLVAAVASTATTLATRTAATAAEAPSSRLTCTLFSIGGGGGDGSGTQSAPFSTLSQPIRR